LSNVYIPPHFNEERVDVLHQLVREHGLATLVTYGPSGLIASHVPLVLDTSDSATPYGTLRGHLSRANQQWRDYSPDVPALAIFAGPQHYITPSWYPAKTEHGKVVPTWNYIVVHAYGRLETYEDRESLLANVEALTTHHEASRTEPWKVSDAPASYIDAQLKGIIGISLRIDRLEGKWKISQNRSAADQASVAAALQEAGSDASVAMAETMRDRQ
jgi:transcriptional regulator